VGSGTVQEMSEWVEYMTFDGVSPMAELRKKNGHEKPWKVDYFGVGNENWGCGGNMTPEYYGNLYRRYQTYVRNYNPKAPIFKICCGANVDDTYWTENVLKTCYENAPKELHGFMDGISMHYYVHPEGWEIKGSSTDFDDKVWYKTLSKALYIETLINHHTAILDKYDPDKKIGLICDEWGTWFTCEPGTNPGFLYQQSTMRDALVAGLSLNIFNKHCERVKMANIAQLINVLQAVILTDGPKMLKTPTYHVFHMYKYHQDAKLLDSYIDGVKTIGEEKQYLVPNLQESVSIDKDGIITITINNLSVADNEHIDIKFAELTPSEVTSSIVTNKMNAYNTFENPDTVKEEAFKDYNITNDGISFELPACSVVQFRVK
jgi:alpha-N-arabinofuranosidase